MKRVLIDTNIYAAFKRNDKEVVNALSCVAYIGLSSTVLGELYAGFKLGSKESRNICELEEFMDSPRVYFLCQDDNTAVFYATIFRQLKQSGNPIPTNDIWIAAVAMQHGLFLFTKDRHFEFIEGLLRF